MAVTAVDLYPKESWNFVFGQANIVSGCGVFSFARFGGMNMILYEMFFLKREKKKKKKK
jgi:archaemetzincin